MRECNCGVCGKSFKSKTDRRLHKIKEHGGYFTKMEETKIQEEVEEVKKEGETLKEIPKIKMPKEQAKEEWKKYVTVLKKRKEKYLKVMKDAMYQMKEGKELIDVYKIMKEVGLNENNEPKLAIARADIEQVFFEKRDEGSGRFNMEGGWNRSGWKTDVELPQKTFNIHWERIEGREDTHWNIKNKTIKTRVPLIPVELLPEGDLKNYYILWETKEWEEVPETKDPILLKRISENLFVILGSWDLTELEQSIISGGK